MSTTLSPPPPQPPSEPAESRSKIKVTRNAKGDAQWEISVVDGVDATEIVRLRTLAVQQHQALVADLCPAPRPVGSSAA